MFYNVSLWSPTKVSTGQRLVYYPIPVPLLIKAGLGRALKSASCELPMTYLLTHLIIWPAVCLSFYPHLTNVKPSWFSIHILFWKIIVSACMRVWASLKYSQNPLEYAVRVSGRIWCHLPFDLKNSILKKIFFIQDIFLPIHFDSTTCFGKYIFSTNHSNELIHFHYVSFLAKYLQNLLS